MKLKTLAAGLAAVVLSTVLVPIAVSSPAQAQSQTDWYVNDDPTLWEPNSPWVRVNSSSGYGSDYAYTYAIGGADTAKNWAHWYMGNRVGRQEIRVYVPSQNATATVNYNIYLDGREYKREVAQRNISGWHSLGTWNVNGANVTIGVFDNDATQHYQRDGTAASSIGVDAVAMRCVSDCSSTPPTTTTTAAPQAVTITTASTAGTYTVSWVTQGRCDPGGGTSGASGSVALTVVDDGTNTNDGRGTPAADSVVINDICDYDWSATFVTAAGVTCRITARSVEVNNNRINLAIASGSCPTTVTVERPGQVTGVAYRVDNRTNGAGRVVWDAETDATSYDFVLTLSLEDVDDGSQAEIERSLTGQRCCAASVAPGPGLRIRAIEMSVRAVNSAGAGRWSRSVIAGITYPTARPGAVTGLRYDRSSGRIVWQPVSGATAYDVQWRQPGEGAVARAVLCSSSDETRVGSQCALLITRVRHKELDFRVRAKNNAGTNFGPWTGWISDQAETSEPVQPPGLVTGLAFSNGRISWLPTFGATAYSIEWRNAGESITRQTVNCSSSRSCSLSISRAEDRELQFRASAVNDGGSGPWSSWQTSRPEVNTPPPVTGMDYRAGHIVWNAFLGVNSYDVEWRHAGETTVVRTVHCLSSCSLRIDRVRHKELQFRVRGINAEGRGAWPAAWQRRQPEVMTPGPVTGLQYQSGRAVWRAASNASTYEMQMDGRGGARTLTGLACCRSAVADNVTRFRMRALSANLAGPWSAWIAAPSENRPSQVTGIKYINVQASWKRTPSAESYDVAWSYDSQAHTLVRSVHCCFYRIPRGIATSIQVNIRAVNRGGAGPWSGWKTIWTSDIKPPGKVTGLLHEPHQGLAKWDPVPNVTLYQVRSRRTGQASGMTVRCTSDCSKTIDQHRTLPIEFRVRAVNAGGSGPWSDWYRIRPYSEVPSNSPTITILDKHSNPLPLDAEDVTVHWNFVSWATKYTVKWRYLDFDEKISETVKNEGSKAVDDVRKWIENEHNYLVHDPGQAKLGNVDEYRVKNVASNSEDRNYALQFQVVALNRTGESLESSWVYLASSEIRDEFTSNHCKAYALAEDVWTVIGIIGGLYSGGIASAVVAAVKPNAFGTVLKATQMIEGCHETMTDALRDTSPLFRVVLKITGIGDVLDNWECKTGLTANANVAHGGDTLATYTDALDAC